METLSGFIRDVSQNSVSQMELDMPEADIGLLADSNVVRMWKSTVVKNCTLNAPECATGGYDVC